MDAHKMIRMGVGLICLALVVALIPSVTPKSLWRTTKWFEYTTDKQTAMPVPAPYNRRKGEPSQRELTELARKYGVETGAVNEMMLVTGHLDRSGLTDFGRAIWAKYPDLAGRLGFVQIVATRAKAVRYLALLIFLGGCAYLFGALYQTYQAEKDLPGLNLPE